MAKFRFTAAYGQETAQTFTSYFSSPLEPDQQQVSNEIRITQRYLGGAKQEINYEDLLNGTYRVRSVSVFNPQGTLLFSVEDISPLNANDLQNIQAWLRSNDQVTFEAPPISSFDAGPGDDIVVGSAFGDTLGGGDGNDYVNGSGGDDLILGGPRHDLLDGGIGDDIVNGGEGNDTLSGGPGNDTFLFPARLRPSVIHQGNDPNGHASPEEDTVLDFTVGDLLSFEGTVSIVSNQYSSLGPGQISIVKGVEQYTGNTSGVSGATIFVGRDTTPGADLTIRLPGVDLAKLGLSIDKTSLGLDSAAVPVIQFLSSVSSSNEGNNANTPVSVEVTLSGAASQMITVPITFQGSATPGIDYTVNAANLTIRAGESTGTLTFFVTGDSKVEPDETVILKMGIPSNARLGENTSFTHRIVNDDAFSSVALPARVFLPAGGFINLGAGPTEVYGTAGVESVVLTAEAAEVILDQKVSRIYLPDLPSAYLYQQTGNQLNVFSLNEGFRIVSTTLQNDTDGTQLIFPNGTASAKVDASGMRIGEGRVAISAPSAVAPKLGVYAASPDGPSSAAVFLGQSGGFTAASTGLKVYGAPSSKFGPLEKATAGLEVLALSSETASIETVAIARGVTGTELDQLVERVQFDGMSTAELRFQQQGIDLVVYGNSVPIARVAVQNDADGTLITTIDGTMQAKVSAAGMSLGGMLVSATTPGSASPTEVDAKLKAPPARFNVPITENGNFSADAGDVTFILPSISSSYTYRIDGFGFGDKLVAPAGVPVAITDQINFTDGMVSLQYALGGHLVKVLLAGLSIVQDSAIFGVSDLDRVFGSGAFGSVSDRVSQAIAGQGSIDASSSNFMFTVSPIASSYVYTIRGFDVGDRIVGPAGLTPTISDQNSFTDGTVAVQFAKDGNVVKLRLTGLTAVQDGAIFRVEDLNTVFGAGSFGSSDGVVPSLPTPVTPNPSERVSQAITGQGSFNAALSDVTFGIGAISSSYSYTIAGFGAGDRIVGPAGESPTLADQSSFTDGIVTIQYAKGGNVVKVTLTGLTEAQDGAIFSAGDLNQVFGGDSFIS